LPRRSAVNRLRGLVAALALAFSLAADSAPAQDRGEPGRFDFYVLSLSWSPSYCEAEGDRRKGDEQCTHGRPFAFVVHGLWPQYERGFPRACITPAPRIPDALIRSMLDLLPAWGLVIHEWREHGTCSGLDAGQYFNAVRRARERLAIPERFHKLDRYTMVSPDEVESAFLAANPELKPEMIAVTCDSRRLREVRICMTETHVFRPCPEIDRRACRIPRVVMPPVRGG
jgi:ribonuclease T2